MDIWEVYLMEYRLVTTWYRLCSGCSYWSACCLRIGLCSVFRPGLTLNLGTKATTGTIRAILNPFFKCLNPCKCWTSFSLCSAGLKATQSRYQSRSQAVCSSCSWSFLSVTKATLVCSKLPSFGPMLKSSDSHTTHSNCLEWMAQTTQPRSSAAT